MPVYMECLYALAHAFKVSCYRRDQSWTWAEYAIWIGILDAAQAYPCRQGVR